MMVACWSQLLFLFSSSRTMNTSKRPLPAWIPVLLQDPYLSLTVWPWGCWRMDSSVLSPSDSAPVAVAAPRGCPGGRGVPAVPLYLYTRGFVTSSRNKGPSFFPSPPSFPPLPLSPLPGGGGAGAGGAARQGAARARRARAPSGGAMAMAAAAMAAVVSRCGGAPRGEGGGAASLGRGCSGGLRGTREGREGAAARAGGGVPVPFRACLRRIPSGAGVAPPFSRAAAEAAGPREGGPGSGDPQSPSRAGVRPWAGVKGSGGAESPPRFQRWPCGAAGCTPCTRARSCPRHTRCCGRRSGTSPRRS